MTTSREFGDGRDPARELAWLRELVLRAGTVLRDARGDEAALEVRHKGSVDLVTRVDHELQGLPVSAIRERHPGDRVVAEEGDRAKDEAEDARPVWYVDPLDGTTNFVHGHLFHAISVGCWWKGRPRLGAVYAPALDELYLAREAGGATLEAPGRGGPARTLGTRPCAGLDDALLATGFPYARGQLARWNLALCAHALSRARGIRRAGSAALDLCWVGAGRLDGYWELALGPWDVAAGALVALEAGARVTDFEGGDRWLDHGRICCASSELHPELLDMLERGRQAPDLDVLGPPLPSPVPADHFRADASGSTGSSTP